MGDVFMFTAKGDLFKILKSCYEEGRDWSILTQVAAKVAAIAVFAGFQFF